MTNKSELPFIRVDRNFICHKVTSYAKLFLLNKKYFKFSRLNFLPIWWDYGFYYVPTGKKILMSLPNVLGNLLTMHRTSRKQNQCLTHFFKQVICKSRWFPKQVSLYFQSQKIEAEKYRQDIQYRYISEEVKQHS